MFFPLLTHHMGVSQNRGTPKVVSQSGVLLVSLQHHPKRNDTPTTWSSAPILLVTSLFLLRLGGCARHEPGLPSRARWKLRTPDSDTLEGEQKDTWTPLRPSKTILLSPSPSPPSLPPSWLVFYLRADRPWTEGGEAKPCLRPGTAASAASAVQREKGTPQRAELWGTQFFSSQTQKIERESNFEWETRLSTRKAPPLSEAVGQSGLCSSFPGPLASVHLATLRLRRRAIRAPKGTGWQQTRVTCSRGGGGGAACP